MAKKLQITVPLMTTTDKTLSKSGEPADAKATGEAINKLTTDKITKPVLAALGYVLAVKAIDENGTPTEFEAVAPDVGEKGDPGVGISSITKTATEGLVDTYTITLTDGSTATFIVTNGEKGDKGDTGADGVGIVSITKTATEGLVDTYTITLTNGSTKTFTVTNGEKGEKGDSGLPEVTEENNGSVLQVVNGVWSIAEIPVYADGNEVSY